MDDKKSEAEAVNECIVDIAMQKMVVRLKNGFQKVYNISTAANGMGGESGSYKTPPGKHQIVEKIGEFAPTFSIFKSRQNTGNICNQINAPIDDDLILTRILRLRGLETGVNAGYTQDNTCVDSYDRYIYIHGTNREDLLGTPASHGCIRMANSDIEELFMQVQQDTLVEIKGSYIYLHSTNIEELFMPIKQESKAEIKPRPYLT